ncbi:MAG TPA: class I SAM-dependent methyltransferase [Kofleriaceae bacterium]|nr:class I SAM-dependent methyltransferase [Kofleriaceae bacterium]
MTSSENFLREFHTAHAGATSRAFARAGSYARLTARVPPQARVLDLACGDGALLAELGAGALGIDVTLAELHEAQARLARAGAPGSETLIAAARAQALPFAAHRFDAVTCHLAFMLFDDLPAVVRELERVLVPGGDFVALLGGGPTADGDDAFHRFLALLDQQSVPRTVPRLGDPRAKSEAGWQAVMPRWQVAPFERWTLDLSGSFDEVWSFLGASYEIAPERAPALEAAFRAATREWGELIPCTVVVFLARASLPRST